MTTTQLTMSTQMGASSEQWRVQKSTIPALELASALRSLQKVIGSISPETEAIGYSGMSYNALNERTRMRQIFIDRTFALMAKEFPIPSENFDVLVGLAAHEAGHTVTDAVSDEILVQSKRASQVNQGESDAKAITSSEFIALCEEIYTDGYVRRHFPVQSEYLQKARKAYDILADKENRLPDFNNINSTCIYKYVYGGDVDWSQVPPEHTQVYSLLENVNSILSNKDMSRYERIDFYRTTYEAIKNMLGVQISNLKKQLSKSFQEDQIPKSLRRRYGPSDQKLNLDIGGQPEADEIELGDGDGASMDYDPMHSGAGTSLKEEIDELRQASSENVNTVPNPEILEDIKEKQSLQRLMDEVQEHLVSNTEDMSEKMIALIEESTSGDSFRLEQMARSMKTTPSTHSQSRNKHMQAPVGEEKELAKDLDWMRRIKNTLLRQNIRSQAEGILDKRRLHRHSIDGLVYKKRHILQQEDLELVLLVDSSSSMSRTSIVYKAANALHSVLPDAKILSYAESGGVTRIQDCTWDGKLREIIPTGNTPSGKALLVTAMKHPKSLIIHFSDGEANADVRPRDILPVIAEKYPKVQIANILQKPTTRSMTEYGGGDNIYRNSTVKGINVLDEFPEALKVAIEPWYRSR